MGYVVFIERQEDPILLDEWRALCDCDPEMEWKSCAESTTSQGLQITLAGNFARWKGHWFEHRQGRIEVSNPTHKGISKMKLIAQALQARVVGEEGEEY